MKILLPILLTSSLQAASLKYSLSVNTTPFALQSTDPGISISILDETDSVTVTISSDLTGTEFMTELGLNLYDTSPVIEVVDTATVGSFTAPTIKVQTGKVGPYAFNQSLFLEFAKPRAQRFDQNDSFTFRITGLSVADFNPTGSVAHIQGLIGGQSTYITTIPEPSITLISALGLLILLKPRR